MTTTNDLRLMSTAGETAALEITVVNADENGESVLGHPGHEILTQETWKYVDSPWGYNTVTGGYEGVRRYQMRTHIEQLFTSGPALYPVEPHPA
jgi:hypothetical protein